MKQSLAQIIYNALKKSILSKEYSGNELITEQKVAQQFGVSKTPAREALAQLCQEGYVTRYPSLGYVVKELSFQQVMDIFELRFILECGAAKIIVKWASDEDIIDLYSLLEMAGTTYEDYHVMNARFHTGLGKLTGNSYLHEDILRMANATARPSSYINYKATQTVPDYHKRIVDALLARDVDAAIENLMLDILPGESRL